MFTNSSCTPMQAPFSWAATVRLNTYVNDTTQQQGKVCLHLRCNRYAIQTCA